MAGERTLKVTILGDADKLRGAFKNVDRDLGEFGSRLDGVAAKFPMFSDQIDSVKVKLGGLSPGQLTAIGGVTALGAVAVVAGKQLFDLGSSFDSAYDKIQIATGKTGKDLETLKQSFRDVAREVPSSFGDVSTAIAELSAKTGLASGQLESLSVQVLNLSRLTGTDLSANVELVAKMMQDWQMTGDQLAGSLDSLFAASQRSGVEFSTLSATLDRFGPTLRGLGLTFEQSTALLTDMTRQGVDTDRVMVGLTRAVTASGLSFAELTARVLAGRTETDQMKIAVDLLGKKVGLEFVDALRSGKISVDSLNGSVGDARDSINQTAKDTDDGAEKMSRAWNRTKVALEPLADGVFELGGYMLDKFATAIDWVNRNFETLAKGGLALMTGGLSLLFTNLDAVKNVVGDIVAPFEAAFGRVLAAIQPVIDAIQWVLDKLPSLPQTAGGIGGNNRGVTQNGTKIRFENGRWVYDGGPKDGQPVPASELSSQQQAMQTGGTGGGGGGGGGPAPTNSQGGTGQTLAQMFAAGMTPAQVAERTGLPLDVVQAQYTVWAAGQVVGNVFGGDFDEDEEGLVGGPARPGEGGLVSNAVKVRREIQNTFRYNNIGGFASRTTSAGTPSDHATGHAVDVGSPGSPIPRALGDAVAAWAINQPEMKYVIWQNQIFSKLHPSWRDYATNAGAAGRKNQGSATGRHEDHVHISVLGRGGIVKARQGGTLALIGEAGQDEAVVPLPAGRETGFGNVYVTVHVHGNVMRERDLALTIRDELIRAKREGVTIGLG